MLISLLTWLIFNQIVYYLVLTVVTCLVAAYAFIEFREWQIQKRCHEQNLRYVKTPIQLLIVGRKKRFDLVENEYMRLYGPVYGCMMFNQLTVTVCNPEMVQIACNKEFTKMPNRRSFTLNDPISDNLLFMTNDDKWKRLRAIISPTFSAGKLRKVKFCIDDTLKTMMQNLEEKLKQDPVINCKEVIGAFTMDTIIQMAYGVKIDSLRDPDSPIIKHAKRIFSQDIPLKDIFLFGVAALFPSVLKFLGLKFQDESFGYFEKLSKEIISKKREEFKQKKGKASNFIELILEVEQEQNEQTSNGNGVHAQSNGSTSDAKSGKYITNDEIVAQCVTFFTVGYDTTASTITNVCYLMANNPEKQEKLHQSIQTTLDHLSEEMTGGQSKDPYELVSFDTINKFEYLNACLNEAQRFYTIVTATERECTEDVRLESADKKIWFDVKKGDVIRVGISKMHSDPECFSNPDKFIPERFLPDSPETFNKSAFIPFGTGPRNCLAKSLALLEAKMALVHLFRKYRFSMDPVKSKEIDFYINADVAICKELQLRVEPR